MSVRCAEQPEMLAWHLVGAFRRWHHQVEAMGLAQAAYWNRATADTLGVMALLHFRDGRETEGVTLAREALVHLGRAPNGNAIVAKVIQELAKRGQVGDKAGA